MSEITQYKTLLKTAEITLREKASRFTGQSFHVMNESEARSILLSLRKKYHDATHICYAFRIGYKQLLSRSSDDGEPSGTAGKPMLAQIDSLGLTYVMITCIRYFGGTKLGTGGLLHAYRECARQTLEKSEITVRAVNVVYSFSAPYLQYAAWMKLLSTFPFEITHEKHDENFEMQFTIPLQYKSGLEKKCESLGFRVHFLEERP